jgi:hypothetical protein
MFTPIRKFVRDSQEQASRRQFSRAPESTAELQTLRAAAQQVPNDRLTFRPARLAPHEELDLLAAGMAAISQFG